MESEDEEENSPLLLLFAKYFLFPPTKSETFEDPRQKDFERRHHPLTSFPTMKHTRDLSHVGNNLPIGIKDNEK